MPEVIRHNWQKEEIAALFALPFNDLLWQAQTVHRQNFDPNAVQLSQLLSIKTGACPEDCHYCPQSVHHNTELAPEKLMNIDKVLEAAKTAKAKGATRFCMGAAWRSPSHSQVQKVGEMISQVKALGLEACCTLGMLDSEKAQVLKEAGLDYYNHNLDTSPEFYNQITTTRTYEDRLNTLSAVREAGIHVCSGGILGMGESREDRVSFLHTLATLPQHPESVPINQLIAVKGTPFEKLKELDSFEFIRTLAVARILMPKSFLRLSAGRENMSEEMQALCFLAGANSIFYGEKLLTCDNPVENDDQALFKKLGLHSLSPTEANHCDETVVN